MSVVGTFSTLKVDRVDEKGAWIESAGETILLPKSEVPYGTKAGDRFNLFVYRDAPGRLVATRKKPKAQVGEFSRLKVRQVGKPGAFLDWGLEKDLLVPHREQVETMQEGRWYLVKLGLDNRGRVVGTARIEDCLEEEDIDLSEGDEVELLVWRLTPLGCKVIIENRYSGLLYQDEAPEHLQVGDRIRGYVKRIRKDKKIDVGRRRGSRADMDQDKEIILQALGESGFLPLHDGSPPQEIRRVLGMSKKAFKKAVGGLYKARVVSLEKSGIRLLKK